MLQPKEVITICITQNTDAEILISEGSPVSLGSGLYYKFIELQNSTFILSNNIPLQSSNNGMCVLFWLGKDLQIVLTTDVVR